MHERSLCVCSPGVPEGSPDGDEVYTMEVCEYQQSIMVASQQYYTTSYP